MHIPKPSEQDKEFFRSVIPGAPSLEVKAMLGNLGAFSNGNVFADCSERRSGFGSTSRGAVNCLPSMVLGHSGRLCGRWVDLSRCPTRGASSRTGAAVGSACPRLRLGTAAQDASTAQASRVSDPARVGRQHCR